MKLFSFYLIFIKQIIFFFIEKKLWLKFSNKTNYCENFATKQLFVEILKKSKCLKKIVKQSYGTFPTLHMFVEIFQTKKCWEIFNTNYFCGNFLTTPIFFNIIQPSKFLGKFCEPKLISGEIF